jgi:hypothetical protein
LAHLINRIKPKILQREREDKMNPTEKTPVFVLPTSRGKKRKEELQIFSDLLKSLSEKIGFKVSSRGWAYQLETFNYINKGQFDKVQKIINEARKKGFLPIDFVAEEKARQFSGVLKVTKEDPRSLLYKKLYWLKNPAMYHTPDYWYKEEYYIQMLVEKVDLVTLFEPICKKYHIPIANSVGWSSILQRAQMAWRFKEYEEKGHIPVLLYCGDFDPFGLAISDYLLKNLMDIFEGTGWNPSSLMVDRFGVNYDFIMDNNITWIDNLISGSGKKPDLKNPIVKNYISKYGERKVEANAIVIRPKEARTLCQNAIIKYLGIDGLSRMKDKKQVVRGEYDELSEEVDLKEGLDELLNKLLDGGDVDLN